MPGTGCTGKGRRNEVRGSVPILGRPDAKNPTGRSGALRRVRPGMLLAHRRTDAARYCGEGVEAEARLLASASVASGWIGRFPESARALGRVVFLLAHFLDVEVAHDQVSASVVPQRERP
jgi:hypothetical protein